MRRDTTFMKITLEPYSGGTWTASTEAEHIDEVAKLFKGLLVSVGYHPHNVDELFNTEEDQWFLDGNNASVPDDKPPIDPDNLFQQTT